MKNYLFITQEKYDGYKLIDYLKGEKISDEIIKKLKGNGIFVNGNLNLNINDRIKANDKIELKFLMEEKNPFIVPKKQKLEILYEDDYFLAVNKERGMLSHSSRYNSCTALDQIILAHYLPENFVFRAITRLDRDTSGIVLIAKDMLSASRLSEKIKNGEIKKTYSAIVMGKPKEKHFIIEKPIKRQSPSSMKRIISDDGKYAKSECFFIKEIDENRSLIDIILHTGRTHQIRAHLSSIGYPLYADKLYGKEVIGENYFLHAKRLEFIHPFVDKKIIIESPIK